jgi:hypothetical protein
MVFTSTSLPDIIEKLNVTFIDVFVEVSNEISLLAIPITEVVESGMDLQSTGTEHQYDENDSEKAYTGCHQCKHGSWNLRFDSTRPFFHDGNKAISVFFSQ